MKEAMRKEILSFRVESRLLAQFINAALKANRSPTEVLIEFMGDYVTEVRARNVFDFAGPMPHLEESKSRKVIDFARASNRLRLLHAQKEGDRLASYFLRGETFPL